MDDVKPDLTPEILAKLLKEARDEAADRRVSLKKAEEERDQLKAQVAELSAKPNTLLEQVRSLLKLDKGDEKAVIEAIGNAVNTSSTIGSKAKSALLAAAWAQASQKAGVVSAEDALKLADLSKVQVDLDTQQVVVMGEDGKPAQKDGKPVTLDNIVADLVTAKPFLKGAAPSGTGGFNPPASGVPGELSIEELGNLSMEQYIAYMEKRDKK